jgi:hypothetical protein
METRGPQRRSRTYIFSLSKEGGETTRRHCVLQRFRASRRDVARAPSFNERLPIMERYLAMTRKRFHNLPNDSRTQLGLQHDIHLCPDSFCAPQLVFFIINVRAVPMMFFCRETAPPAALQT